jgi:hypothetical protein
MVESTLNARRATYIFFILLFFMFALLTRQSIWMYYVSMPDVVYIHALDLPSGPAAPRWAHLADYMRSTMPCSTHVMAQAVGVYVDAFVSDHARALPLGLQG